MKLFCVVFFLGVTNKSVCTADNTLRQPRRLQTYTQLSDYESLMLERVNSERAAQGLPALCSNSKLQEAAQRHSDDQAANNFMDHTGSDGSSMSQRVTDTGYDWRGVAENVAAGQVDVTAVIDDWMNSEGHSHNILGDYTMLGTAYAYTSDGLCNHFWTQDFGRSDTEQCDDGSTPATSSSSTNSSDQTSSYQPNSSNSGDNTMSAPNRRDPRVTSSFQQPHSPSTLAQAAAVAFLPSSKFTTFTNLVLICRFNSIKYELFSRLSQIAIIKDVSMADTCTATTHMGARCTSPATDSSGQCSHHARMARVMALAPKAPTPTSSSTSSSSSSLFPASPAHVPSLSPSSSSSSSFDMSPLNSSLSRDNCLQLLPGENVLHSINCSFVFPGALALPEIPGTLYITSFRLRFEPQSSSLRVCGGFHRLLDIAIRGMPRAAVARLSYPQATASASRSMNGYNNGGGLTPTRLVIKFKDLRSWTLGGDVTRLLPALNRYAYVDSPLSLFAFTSMGPTQEDLQGHQLYDLYEDFARMGVALRDGSSAYRVTELNNAFAMCPTYPRQLVVPAAASDSEVGAVASFRSKGRLPICSYVHARNGAALWRCAQPKRGILHAQNPADEQYLLHIAHASSNSTSLYSGTPTRKIWIADCRPELNARVNNLTGGGTESGNLAHARVTFLNIGNIHAMREGIESVRGLGGFTAPTNNTESMDLSWGSRVEDTKWLSHVRRVLSGALQVARAMEAQATTVVVHCSDGWDRTAQLCGLAQLLVDAHYRTRRGFLEVIEKEWVRPGHKFQDRVGPGNAEDDDDQQAPIFLQFLDCVWQLIRIYPTYFEFNERMLEATADALFSGRYGTFLGNCERERVAWSVRERTASLYAFLLQDDRFVNPFYRASSTGALLPDAPAVLRQVTLWTSYYFRGAPFPASPAGNPTPPMYAADDVGDDVPSSGAQEDMEITMASALRRIRSLEEELRAATTKTALPPRPAPVSYPPLYSAASEADMSASIQQNSQPDKPTQYQGVQPSNSNGYHHSTSSSSISSNDGSAYGAPNAPGLTQVPTPPPTPGAALTPVPTQQLAQAATWTCSLCTKTNAADVLRCVVCGRTPRSPCSRPWCQQADRLVRP